MKPLDIFERLVSILKQIPPDIHALNMLIVGAVLVLRGHSDQGALVIGGALTLLKGHQPPTAQV